MPRLFLETCRQKDDYMMHLNRNLGRATMNLEWKNRFLESRDTVMVQFRELALILDEFAHQMEQATDITERREAAVRRVFRLHQAVVENMLILEYENRRREAYLTVRMLGGRCMTSRDAAELFGQAMGSGVWYAPADTRNLITRQSGTIRFAETGQYRMVCGAARIPKEGEQVSGDNYTFINLPGQAVLSLSDGLGSGETACKESGRVVELTQQLLEAGFSARSALKMVNTILLLTGAQQHPATVDLCCVDLHTGVLEAMKMGAVAAFVLHEGSAEILEAGQVPAGVIGQAEPLLLSKKLWDGDRIVMVTDGVLDAWPGEDKEGAVKEYLEGMILKAPQEMAEEILQFACQWGDGPQDDMTVLAAGVWKR
jgi:stage II sporulation protein E